MTSLGLVTRINVLTAIRDHDQQGPVEFRDGLGFTEASDEVVVERGKRYDARAVLAYAHGKATGEYLGPDQVSLSELRVLVDLGFSVVSIGELNRPKPAARRTRATGTPKPRTTAVRKPEPVVKLCPTCFTQLSVAGSCDYCD
ncbi:hypothetical protein ABIE44_003352 [Marmoricola sp. OAE513]|uniref:hypothetical protein n=1 Tax=Marmoricola sp. OAE513 TaxID=2817894 RepID=UPI001AE98B33